MNNLISIFAIILSVIGTNAQIFNGKDVSIADQSNHKHTVKLSCLKGKDTFSCGATIVGTRLLLTAGHCVTGATSATAYFGLRDQSTKESAQKQTVVPADWTVHNEFDMKTLVNDIAVIKLKADIQFSDLVGKAELPPATMTCISLYTGVDAIISGWEDIDDKKTKTTILQYANVKVASEQECGPPLQGMFQSKSMLCGDATTSGTCVGDSGGSMMANIERKYTLIGITSFGVNKCETHKPRAFTCVSLYIDWIGKAGKGFF